MELNSAIKLNEKKKKGKMAFALPGSPGS